MLQLCLSMMSFNKLNRFVFLNRLKNVIAKRRVEIVQKFIDANDRIIMILIESLLKRSEIEKRHVTN